VILLTDARGTDPQNGFLAGHHSSTVSIVSMMQLIFGAALGFLIGEGVLHGLKRLVAWIRRDGVQQRLRELPPLRGPALLGGFIKYAGILGVIAGVIALGVWTVGDYFAARSAGSVASTTALDPVPAAADSESPPAPVEGDAALAPAPKPSPAVAAAADDIDPYADSDFKVHRRPHQRGAASLKETLVERSEAKARADLLRRTQEHMHRSQYDCEAAERASRYLKAGLDVWGFATWQVKYFPTVGYKGATLPECKDIKNVVDTPGLEVHSAVADENHA
jgi:hypothetical protein